MGLYSRIELQSTQASVDVSFMESHDHVLLFIFVSAFLPETSSSSSTQRSVWNELPMFIVDSSGIRETMTTMSRL